MYYVCENYGCIWSGRVDHMIEGYSYPENATWFFDSFEEAENYVNSLYELLSC